MKIISWNCNMAFRKKATEILKLKPDILVVQECENKQKLLAELKELNANSIIWVGNNQHKGLGIFSFNKYKIRLSEKYNPLIEYFVALKLTFEKQEAINLFALWAMAYKRSKLKSYVGRVWAGINYYEEELNQSSILIGDLNSNAIWDKERKVGNHTEVVKFLRNKGMVSLFHSKFKQEQGQENQPTFYLHRNESKPYHLDYCFASRDLITDKTQIEIGRYHEWIQLSDHMPLMIKGIDIS